MPNDGSISTDMRLYPRDGRVRNPVPSKLKDVNEQMKGNFGVMHMDVASHRASEGRDAAAKRTSESTALQAKLAQTDTYVSHQRRANYPRATGLKQFSSPKKSDEPVAAAAAAAAAASVSASASASATADPSPGPGPGTGSGPGPRIPLTVADTKAEQARLLTLLRTLPPNTVVDQICKALAFFGGIPEAPPPTDGKFPESAESNGSGSLFVGWIAEIFPNLERPRRSVFSSAPTPSASQRRPRGRPKGSKASKARSDKGIKKGSQKGIKGPDNQVEDPQDESWVDVEDSVLELNDHGDLVEAESSMRNAPSTPPRVPDIEPATATPVTGSTGGFRSINDTNNVPLSNTKRRGRPKGSKNRPKDNAVLQPSLPTEPASANNQLSTQATSAPVISSQAQPAPPKVTPVPVPVPILDTQAKKKSNSGRPKGTKNRAKSTNETTALVPSVPQQITSTNKNSSNPYSTETFAAAMNPGLTDSFAPSTANGAGSQDKQTRVTTQTTAPTLTTVQPPPTTHQVKPSSVTGKKRKRQVVNHNDPTSKGESSIAPGAGGIGIPQQAQPSISQAMSVPQVQSHSSQPEQQPALGVAPIPPAKRSRKSQESNSIPSARRQTPSNSAGQKSSIPSINMSTEPPRQPSQGGVTAQNHLPAEGLEAHYAAMQSRSDQMQNYSNGRPHQKQQHPPAASISSTVSPISGSNQAPAEGLEAHYERFAALQNLQDNSRQSSASRQQKQQQTTQTASPISAQASKTPQISATLASQQQARASQNYYAQTQTLSSSYNTQQPSYPATQRQQPHMASGSPGTALVQHVTNSPQFSAQSNSPLMQADNSYRGSPSLVHNTAAFAPRRTPSASPLDSSAYRPTSAASHGLPGHSPHFGTRPPPTTTHSTSHPGLPTSFPSFSDPSFLDIQSLDSGNNHSSLGLGTGSYGLGSGNLPQQQRTSSSSAAPLYSPATAMNTNYLGSSNMGRTSQNRWPS